MTTRHYVAIAGLVVGIVGLGVAVNQPLRLPSLQWAAFITGTVGFVAGMVIACTGPSEPMK